MERLSECECCGGVISGGMYRVDFAGLKNVTLCRECLHSGDTSWGAKVAKHRRATVEQKARNIADHDKELKADMKERGESREDIQGAIYRDSLGQSCMAIYTATTIYYECCYGAFGNWHWIPRDPKE